MWNLEKRGRAGCNIRALLRWGRVQRGRGDTVPAKLGDGRVDPILMMGRRETGQRWRR